MSDVDAAGRAYEDVLDDIRGRIRDTPTYNETVDGHRKIRVAIRRDRSQVYLEWAEPRVALALLDDPDEVLVQLRHLVDRRHGADGEVIGFLAFDRDAGFVDHLRFKDGFSRPSQTAVDSDHRKAALDAADGRWSR